ncbi:MAG: pyruvate dehydrogenase (acetyl-transferring) E1 component subunit alpha [Euryarchaeota archaeon]|nr:pyruvate dehydrogenase (acetyl-transferring) E1 component subunit alpha [Euryarchaeota archaeon]
MPRSEVDWPNEVTYLQILDADGKVDEDLEPDLPKETLIKLYKTMVLVREFDAARLRLQRQGEIGTFAPSTGQEAAQLGSICALKDSDWFVPSFRETAAQVWRGAKLENDLLYVAGFEEGMALPEDTRDLPISIPVGSQVPHAVGIAWASKMRDEDTVTMCYFGDGATSEGDFHEGLTFAGVFEVPVVFLNQNNHWAISVPRERQTASKTLAQKALAYGIPGVQVDGNDVLAVYAATKEAVDRARDGDGPTMIEALTYRMGIHTTADDPTKYREESEVEKWRERDPIDRMRVYLMDKGHMDEDDDEAWREEAKKEIKAAIERYRDNVPDDLGSMFEHTVAERDPYLERQRKELMDYWERAGVEVGH